MGFFRLCGVLCYPRVWAIHVWFLFFGSRSCLSKFTLLSDHLLAFAALASDHRNPTDKIIHPNSSFRGQKLRHTRGLRGLVGRRLDTRGL